MPDARFDDALPFVLRWEGGFVDHPADPGGRTNKGVTQRTYDGWRGARGLAPQDVKGITDAEVHAIYEAEYWQRARCPDLGDPLDLAQFDTAVNMGVGRAVRFLQASLGCGVDGAYGGETARAVAGCDPGSVVATYCQAREAYYRRLVAANPKLGVFLKGWLNRLNALRREIGLPGYESVDPTEGESMGAVARIPDIGVDAAYDL